MSGERQSFSELLDVEYTTFRKSLLRKKGSDQQCRFLREALVSESFLRRMSEIQKTGNKSVQLVAEKLTENEFKDPPTIVGQDIISKWSLVPPSVACRSTFWAWITLDHIRHGRIESSFLAANGGSLPGGRERIERVLADDSSERPRLVDKCVRTVFRRLGGLPEVRGNRSVYVDCPFARTWWRERWVQHASQEDPELEKHLRNVVRISQTYWEKFIDRVVFRNSTFGDENLRSSFLRSLAYAVRNEQDHKLRNTEGLRRLCRRVTAYQGGRELSVLSEVELDELMEVIVEEP